MHLIKYFNNKSNYVFSYFSGDILLSSIYYDMLSRNWYISYYNKNVKCDKTYEINNIINLTEEQYFQESIAWDFPFPFHYAYNIINKAYKNSCKFDNFSTITNYYIEE